MSLDICDLERVNMWLLEMNEGVFAKKGNGA